MADVTIDELLLDTPRPGPVVERGPVPGHPGAHIIVHVIVGLAWHVGHADILREGIDGAADL